MSHNIEDYLKPETIQRIKDNHLVLEINNEIGEIDSPRIYAGVKFIGGEVAIPNNVDKGNCIADFFRNYCKKVLKCQTHDTVWAEVHQHHSSDDTYSIKPIGYTFSNETAGVIYIHKEKLREEFGVKRITKSIENTVKARFVEELERYSEWSNGHVYFVTLTNEEGYVDDIRGEIYDLDDEMDREVNNMIDSVLLTLEKQ